MNKKKKKNPVELEPLASGQIWRMAGADLHIEGVGRLLVNYKLFRPDAKKTSTAMSPKRIVGEFLTKNRAVLVQ